MSIRPANYDELPETSFEDMDTTFTKGVLHNKQSQRQMSPILRQHNGAIPTPSSATSSDGTIFSDRKERYGLNNKTDEEEEEEEEDFLDDFQEFQSRKVGFDDALQNYFRLRNEPSVYRKGSTFRNVDARISDLANDFDNRLSIGSNKPRRPKVLRQPRSMMNLNTHSRQSGNNGALSSSNAMPNSISTGDLRVKSNGTVRFKKSMPTLSNFNPTIEEEEEEEEEGQESTFRGDTSYISDNYLKNFMEGGDEENEDGFVFDESLIQPQFLSKTTEASPLKLSPSQYEIVRDDALLTPRLHKRHKDWNDRRQLDSFAEHRPNHGRRKPTRNNTATSRIRIIKQEIDHNTPMKNGRMYYNPKTMKWEGNEQILDRFSKLESIDKKPLLIKTKSQLVETASQNYDNELESKNEKKPRLKPKKSFTNSKIVGKMMYDEDNLRWVSVHGNDEEDDPFAGIDDVLPTGQASPNGTLKIKQNGSPFYRSQSQLLPSSSNAALDRLASQGTTRYHSVGLANNRDSEPDFIDPAFQLNSKMLEKFCHEENRWNRKVSGWFILGNKESETVSLGSREKTQKHKSYMFEIRNMVISSTRS